MATRSTIALEYKDGTVKQIYCHFDGYFGGVGKVLSEHYTDYDKVVQLMELGDISYLRPEIGEKQDFNNPTNTELWTLAYSRDRGDSKCQARKFNDYDFYMLTVQSQEYNYILRKDGRWYWRRDGYKTSIELDRELVS